MNEAITLLLVILAGFTIYVAWKLVQAIEYNNRVINGEKDK